METALCRVCLVNPGTVNIFEEVILDIPGKMMRCTRVSVSREDGLPAGICSGCEAELEVAYCFVTKCEEAYARLRAGALVKQELYESHDGDDYYEVPAGDEDIALEDKFKLPIKIENLYLEPKVERGKKGRPKKNKNNKSHMNCEQCGLLVNSKTSLDSHMRIHTGDRPFPCTQCHRKFSRKDNLIRHMVCHQPNRPQKKYNTFRPKFEPVQCSQCSLVLKTPSALITHLRTHTGERPFSCDMCGKQYRAKGCLKRHIESNHTPYRVRNFICEACGKAFYRKRDIVIHMGIHTGIKPHVCPFCPQKFVQISSLIRHKRTHTGDKPYSCELCGRSFADKSLLNKHATVHTTDRNYKCQLCDKNFKTKQILRVHTGLHRNEKNHVCSYCGLAFSLRGNLKLHVDRLHSEKSGVCTVCSKSCSNLEIHMRKHTGEKPYNCALCKRAFTTKLSLTNHVNFKHSNRDKYKCSVKGCSMTFPIPSMLEFHILKYHTHNTPHVCPHCARGFFRMSDLSRHLRMTHMDPVIKVKSPMD